MVIVFFIALAGFGALAYDVRPRAREQLIVPYLEQLTVCGKYSDSPSGEKTNFRGRGKRATGRDVPVSPVGGAARLE
ncbi:hypothetical protein [Paraburkholderia sp. BL18I3N2]|uniref:hypothetical protein n=1 Tax=Paraburkholderia sp. BL18I3N2 TaxID=1938799 RepID=UPI0011B21B35|nr:hypothetical protein [Paraburkholderia sp. BL18I3N2]